MTKDTCSKRVILRPGVNLSLGISAALAFDEAYILPKKAKTGIYHYVTYRSTVGHFPGDGEVEEHAVDVYHTDSSIVVRPSVPKKQPQVALKEPEPMTPREALAS